MAFIAYQASTDVPVDTGSNRFAIQAKMEPSTYPMMSVIPALFTVRSDGRILSVTDGFADLVRHIKLYDLVPDTAIHPLQPTSVAAKEDD